MSYRRAYGDRRYGCVRCTETSRAGYLDRLKKGAKHVEHLSLQFHVETYHPEMTDWLNLRLDLPRHMRGPRQRGIRAARTASAEDDTNEVMDQQLGDATMDTEEAAGLVSETIQQMAKVTETSQLQMEADLTDDDMTEIQTTEDRQRDEITALRTTLRSQAEQNRHLLNWVVNDVEGSLGNKELSATNVWGHLITISRNDEEMAEQIVGPVLGELRRRRR